jgi:hypothetical protein
MLVSFLGKAMPWLKVCNLFSESVVMRQSGFDHYFQEIMYDDMEKLLMGSIFMHC